jgi:hypothetical protein
MNREATKEKIAAFAELKAGWDGYDGLPIGSKTIDAALELLPTLPPRYVHALPVGDGTIWFTSANEEHILEVWANVAR